ncbi:MAG TPA: GtrA family protein [Polyangiaceae bacterium]|nr:GtrA family protein [Polyangiaceae bacterium]
MLSQRAHEPVRASELFVVLKAMLSSGAATITDGVVYQILLFVLPAHYGLVAAAGAIAGAVVNFLINRHYTFARSAERAWPQAIRYATVSLLTFCVLRLLLAGSVEGLDWSPRVAWLPAKLLAFMLVSYPAQRLWVFSRRASA